jgi:hypothetical protein
MDMQVESAMAAIAAGYNVWKQAQPGSEGAVDLS